MSTFEVGAGIDSIEKTIAAELAALRKAKTRIAQAVANLTDLPTIHAVVIAEIAGYVPTGAFETLKKDELSRLTPEFTELKIAAQDAVAALEPITEF